MIASASSIRIDVTAIHPKGAEAIVPSCQPVEPADKPLPYSAKESCPSRSFHRIRVERQGKGGSRGAQGNDEEQDDRTDFPRHETSPSKAENETTPMAVQESALS